MKSPPIPRRRTAAIVILTLLAIVAGIYAVLDVLRFLHILPIAQLGDMNFYTLSWLGALFAGILALIWFVTANRLWSLDLQGWLFAVIVATLNLILLLLSWMGNSSFSAVLPGLIINGLALLLGLLPSTKAAYNVPTSTPTSR